jgi:hypothetical protein
VLRKGNEVTDIWLAQRLKPYGIVPKIVWINGEQGRGYTMAQCEETFKRYIPRAKWEGRKAELQESKEDRKQAEEKKKEEDRVKAEQRQRRRRELNEE